MYFEQLEPQFYLCRKDILFLQLDDVNTLMPDLNDHSHVQITGI
jgi:hypothetical protein